ncbi:hypothetical protein KX729_33040 [Rhizobium sp. XQZ8]|uniref:hypothetical protein n=1 Tax=Rhizobium populisoli TaxID=2859785 RepID=UPI001CA4FF1D|nr:hypothetical protein [Rhizobium populisoli]MBW6426175.1 hypothetical protein [Rhizobium populisoli]
MPYTLHMNDMNFPFQGYDPHAHEQALRDEFDQLFEEVASRRRMTVIGMHDRLSGHASRIRALDRFFTYAKSHDDVWFARKDEIARWALTQREFTPIVHRGPPWRHGCHEPFDQLLAKMMPRVVNGENHCWPPERRLTPH